jgi:hypothetical protein
MRVKGIASFFGPDAQMIAGALALYGGANVLVSQIYCLMYRYSVIKHNQSFHRVLMTTRSKVLLCLIGQLFSITIGFLGYKSLIPPEVVLLHT